MNTMKNTRSIAMSISHPAGDYDELNDIIDSELEWQRESYLGSGLSDAEIEQRLCQLKRERYEFFSDPESYDPRCLDLSPVAIDGCLAPVAGTSSIGKRASATEKPNKECHDTILRLLRYLKRGDINKICNKAGVSDYVFYDDVVQKQPKRDGHRRAGCVPRIRTHSRQTPERNEPYAHTPPQIDAHGIIRRSDLLTHY